MLETVERVQSLERSRFENEFVTGGRPVVLPGLVSQWEATCRWTPEYLATVCGDREVEVEVYPSGDYHDIRGFTLRSMKVAEYLERIANPPRDGTERYYLVAKLPGTLPELQRQIETPAYVDVPRLDHATLFLGRDTVTNCHIHARHHALLCIASGSKTLELYPPEETATLDPEPWYSKTFAFSRVHPDVPERFPNFRPRRRHVVELNAGDALFIPVHWWHWVHSTGFTAGVTYFWRAPLRDWSFPVPGTACLAALPFELKGRVINRVKRALDTMLKRTPATSAR